MRVAARVPGDRIDGQRSGAARRGIAVAAVVGLGALAAVAGVARGGRGDFVGSAACGACHPAELAAWRRTDHATATARLGDRPAVRCLTCHGTGEAPAGEVAYAEVGCEACHGAGAGYAPDDVMRDPPLARALGLRDLSTLSARSQVCSGCHRGSLRLVPFDPRAPVHPVPLPPTTLPATHPATHPATQP